MTKFEQGKSIMRFVPKLIWLMDEKTFMFDENSAHA